MRSIRPVLCHVGALCGVIAMLIGVTPIGHADPVGGVGLVTAPTLSLADLGSDATLTFYGNTGSTTLSIPVPAGLTPTTMNATLDVPFGIRSGTLTVTQDDRLISKLGLPPTDLAPLTIPLDGVDVVNQSATVTLTLAAAADDGFCLDQLNPIDLINGSVTYAGTEAAPTTIADFLPPILRTLTIAVPSAPSRAESDAAVQLAAAMVARYRGQALRVVLVSLADGATQLANPPQPMERQIVIKEGPQEGLSLIGGTDVPQLLISGPPDKLTNQTRLLTDGSLNMAVSTKAVAGELRANASLPGDSTTLAQLNQPVLTAAGVAPQVSIPLDQTRFGHPTQGFRLHLIGSYTPIPAAFGAQMTASVGGETIDWWPTDSGGVVDHWVDVPDRLVTRYTTLSVGVNTSGYTGRCGEFRPITLTIRGSTTVESTPARPPIPQGFPSLPQALMPKVQVGIGANSFIDTVRATQLIAGLQRLSAVPLSTEVTSLKEAEDSHDPAVLVSADGWTDTSITLPVSANDRSLTLTGFSPGDQPTTLTLDPGIQFGSLQTVFDGQRSLLIATSNGAPNQLDDLLRWLDDDSRRWSQLTGSAVVDVAGRPPALVPGRTPVSIYGPAKSTASQVNSQQNGHHARNWWIGGGLIAVVAVGAVALGLRTRRSRVTGGEVHPPEDGES